MSGLHNWMMAGLVIVGGGMWGCGPEKKVEPKIEPQEESLMLSLLETSYVLVQQDQDVKLHECQDLCPEGLVTVEIVAVLPEQKGCVLELTDKNSGQKYKGKVEVGNAVSFAPELVGTKGLECVAVKSDCVTLRRTICESVRTVDGKIVTDPTTRP